MKKWLTIIVLASAVCGGTTAAVALDKWPHGVPAWVVSFPCGCAIGLAWGVLEHKMEGVR